MDKNSQRQWLRILGAFYWVLGDYSKSIEAQQKAVDISVNELQAFDVISEKIESSGVRAVYGEYLDSYSAAEDLRYMGDLQTASGATLNAFESYEKSWQYLNRPLMAGYYLDVYFALPTALKKTLIGKAIQLISKAPQTHQTRLMKIWKQRLIDTSKVENLSYQANELNTQAYFLLNPRTPKVSALENQQKDIDKAISISKNALRIAQQVGDPWIEIDALNHLSNAYLYKNNHAQSFENALEALKLSFRHQTIWKMLSARDNLTAACCSNSQQEDILQQMSQKTEFTESALKQVLQSKSRFGYNLKLIGLDNR